MISRYKSITSASYNIFKKRNYKTSVFPESTFEIIKLRSCQRQKIVLTNLINTFLVHTYKNKFLLLFCITVTQVIFVYKNR